MKIVEVKDWLEFEQRLRENEFEIFILYWKAQKYHLPGDICFIFVPSRKLANIIQAKTNWFVDELVGPWKGIVFFSTPFYTFKEVIDELRTLSQAGEEFIVYYQNPPGGQQ